MYRRDADGVLHVREAWIYEAWEGYYPMRTREGKVGTKLRSSYQSTRSDVRPERPTGEEILADFAAQGAADGYRELGDDAAAWVVLQCWTSTPDLSDADDARLFEHGTDALDLYLGDRGVGYCDGHDIGGFPPPESGQRGTVMNLFCRVVDATLGVRAVRGFVRSFGLGPHHVIGAREADTDYELAYSPRKAETAFDLMRLTPPSA